MRISRNVIFWTAAVLAVTACGRRQAEKPPAAQAAPAPTPAPAPVGSAPGKDAPPPPPAQAVPAVDLLASVPADTPYLFVMLEPMSADARQRLVWDLAPVAAAARAGASDRLDAGAGTPIDRLLWAALAELPGDLSAEGLGKLGLAATPRFAVFSAGGVGLLPVFHMESAEPAALQAAVERVIARAGLGSTRAAGPVPHWIIETPDAAVVVAVNGGHLIVSKGAPAAVRAALPSLLAARAAAPVDAAVLRKLAADHGLSPQGIGWLDLARLVPELRGIQDALAAADPDMTPRCWSQVFDVFASLPRISFGLEQLSATRFTFGATFDVDAATAAALQKGREPVAGVPPSFPDAPLFGFAAASAPAPWLPRAQALVEACGGAGKLPPPWSDLRGGALAIYDGTWKDLLPTDVDAYVGVVADDPAAILAALGALNATFAVKAPADGGPFVSLRTDKLAPFARSAALARKDKTVMLALGGRGKRAAAAALAPTAPPPFVNLFVDVARIGALLDARASKEEDIDLEYGLAAESGWNDAMSRLAASLTLTVEPAPLGPALRIDVPLAPPRPHLPAPPPGHHERTVLECRVILDHAWAATAPARAKLGVTAQVDELERTYKTSIEARSAVESCLELDAAARKCLLDAPDPITAAPRCAPGGDSFHPSSLALPPLFSFFGPKPLDAVVHPRVDGRPIIARLAGTWQDANDPADTWQIDASGRAVHHDHNETDTFTLTMERRGELQEHESDTAWRTERLFMPDDDTFYLYAGGDAVPVANEGQFLAPLAGDSFVIGEPTGCSVVTRDGLLVPAKCEIIAPQERLLRVQWSEPGNDDREDLYRFLAGHLVDTGLLEHRYLRKR